MEANTNLLFPRVIALPPAPDMTTFNRKRKALTSMMSQQQMQRKAMNRAHSQSSQPQGHQAHGHYRQLDRRHFMPVTGLRPVTRLQPSISTKQTRTPTSQVFLGAGTGMGSIEAEYDMLDLDLLEVLSNNDNNSSVHSNFDAADIALNMNNMTPTSELEFDMNELMTKFKFEGDEESISTSTSDQESEPETELMHIQTVAIKKESKSEEKPAKKMKFDDMSAEDEAEAEAALLGRKGQRRIKWSVAELHQLWTGILEHGNEWTEVQKNVTKRTYHQVKDKGRRLLQTESWVTGKTKLDTTCAKDSAKEIAQIVLERFENTGRLNREKEIAKKQKLGILISDEDLDNVEG